MILWCRWGIPHITCIQYFWCSFSDLAISLKINPHLTSTSLHCTMLGCRNGNTLYLSGVGALCSMLHCHKAAPCRSLQLAGHDAACFPYSISNYNCNTPTSDFMMTKVMCLFYLFINSSVILHKSGDGCISVSRSGWLQKSYTF